MSGKMVLSDMPTTVSTVTIFSGNLRQMEKLPQIEPL